MAIWQFDFYIVPKNNCVSGVKLNSEEILSWKQDNISFDKLKFLDKQNSWSRDIIQYGNEDETCIKFLYEDGMIEEVNCRLDLRSLSKKLLEEILDYINNIDGMIFYEDKIYNPNLDEVIKIMRNSNANKFCQNPREYLQKISKK